MKISQYYEHTFSYNEFGELVLSASINELVHFASIDNDDNDTTQKMTKEEKKASKFTKVDVELESIPKDDRKNTRRRNSLTKMYHNNTVRRKSMKLLGEDVVMDDWLDWRVKWGQRGVGIFAFLALICYLLAGGTNVGLQIAVIIFLALSIFNKNRIGLKKIPPPIPTIPDNKPNIDPIEIEIYFGIILILKLFP